MEKDIEYGSFPIPEQEKNNYAGMNYSNIHEEYLKACRRKLNGAHKIKGSIDLFDYVHTAINKVVETERSVNAEYNKRKEAEKINNLLNITIEKLKQELKTLTDMDKLVWEYDITPEMLGVPENKRDEVQKRLEVAEKRYDDRCAEPRQERIEPAIARFDPDGLPVPNRVRFRPAPVGFIDAEEE